MNTSRMGSANNINNRVGLKTEANSEMLSRQIENLRIVMRRMKTSESSKLNSIINQKLKEMS